jgi:regulatory protein
MPVQPLSLRGRALAALARREHSCAELERKLAPHAESAEQLSQVLQQLQAEGWLSNQRFVESLIRRRGEKLGVARIRQELQTHQLSLEEIQSELAQLRHTEFDRAQALWQKKFGQVAKNPQERARQARFLVARGFAAEMVYRLVQYGVSGD